MELATVGTGGMTMVSPWEVDGRYEGVKLVVGLTMEMEVWVTAWPSGQVVMVTCMVEVLVVGIGAMAEKVALPVG